VKKFWIVFRKEIIDTLRDRRTLLVMVLIPLLVFPLLMKIVSSVTSAQVKKSMEKQLVVATIEKGQASGLLDLFKEEKSFKLRSDLTEEAIKSGIEKGEVDFGLVISPDFMTELAANRPGSLQLYYKGSDEGEMAKQRIDTLLTRFDEKILDERFLRLGLERSIARGIDIVKRDVATIKEKVGEKLGGLIPYLFILFCFMGSMYPAIDLAAGEKERGTIETLLVTPVSRTTIVAAKFAVVVAGGLLSVVLSLTGLLYTLKSMANLPDNFLSMFLSSFGPMTIVSILLLIIPLSVLFAAVMLSISIFSQSFKEAQNLIGPLNILVIVPAFIGMLPGVKLDALTAWIPILNVSLATKQLMMGQANTGLLAIVYGSSLLLALVALAFCSHWFNKESVLFRS
jgi:sodium transport system permease protein